MILQALVIIGNGNLIIGDADVNVKQSEDAVDVNELSISITFYVTEQTNNVMYELQQCQLSLVDDD